jgi:predicted nucleic acid-binding protein
VTHLPAYLDTSAIVKLVVVEPETDDLLEALSSWPERVSAALAEVEVHRALRRINASASQHARAAAILDALVLIRLDDAMLAKAGALEGRELRSLDAIHLAAALTLGDDPAAFVTYDARLARAAARLSLPVAHPGAIRLEA